MWVPPRVSAEMEAEMLTRSAELAAQTQVRETFDHFNRELKEIDPHLELVWAGPNVTAPGLKPGRWHVLRVIPGGPPMIHVHETFDGEFRDPDAGLFEDLKAGDMWNDRSQRETRKRAEKLETARRREAAHEDSDRKQELWERYKHATTPSIRVPRSV